MRQGFLLELALLQYLFWGSRYQNALLNKCKVSDLSFSCLYLALGNGRLGPNLQEGILDSYPQRLILYRRFDCSYESVAPETVGLVSSLL